MCKSKKDRAAGFFLFDVRCQKLGVRNFDFKLDQSSPPSAHAVLLCLPKAMVSSLPGFITILLFATSRVVSGFVFHGRTLPAVATAPPSATRTCTRRRADIAPAFIASSLLRHHPSRGASSCVLFNKANNNNNESIDTAKGDAYREAVLGESEQRGNILFAASLILVLWSFSLPLDLRRTHWCFIDSCVQDRASCYDCLTFGEWCQEVLKFYQSTPPSHWVSFDFSVDPNFVWSIAH